MSAEQEKGNAPPGGTSLYRQRKTRYVKALEGALATSQRREYHMFAEKKYHMFAEKKYLENDIQMLLHLLSQHGIATPGISLPTHPESPQAPTLLPSPLPSPFSIPSNDNASMSSRVCEFDQTMLGMKFVLKIERSLAWATSTAIPQDPTTLLATP